MSWTSLLLKVSWSNSNKPPQSKTTGHWNLPLEENSALGCMGIQEWEWSDVLISLHQKTPKNIPYNPAFLFLPAILFSSYCGWVSTLVMVHPHYGWLSKFRICLPLWLTTSFLTSSSLDFNGSLIWFLLHFSSLFLLSILYRVFFLCPLTISGFKGFILDPFFLLTLHILHQDLSHTHGFTVMMMSPNLDF